MSTTVPLRRPSAGSGSADLRSFHAAPSGARSAPSWSAPTAHGSDVVRGVPVPLYLVFPASARRVVPGCSALRAPGLELAFPLQLLPFGS